MLGKIAIGDRLTAAVGLASLGVLFATKKVTNAMLMAATAATGLAAFPLLQPDWVPVK